jgi:hypothetical protein
MWRTRGVTAAVALAALAVTPVATAQPVDPSVVTSLPVLGRAALSVALVGVVGGAFVFRKRQFVDRAVDDLLARPGVAVLYGLIAYVLVLMVGLYGVSILAEVGAANTPAGLIPLAILVSGAVTLGALGFLVVGTVLTDLNGARRPWQGLAVGAAMSAVGWLALPGLGAVAVWVLIAAFGVGGTTRTWVHSERTVASEREA